MEIDVVRLSAGVENALDQDFEAHAGLPGFGRTFSLAVSVDTR